MWLNSNVLAYYVQGPGFNSWCDFFISVVTSNAIECTQSTYKSLIKRTTFMALDL